MEENIKAEAKELIDELGQQEALSYAYNAYVLAAMCELSSDMRYYQQLQKEIKAILIPE